MVKPMQRIDVSDWSGEKEIILDREGMELNIVGAFTVSKEETKVLRLHIIHRAPNTTAHTLLKGVVNDRGKLELHGTIVVDRNALHTNSFLRENILLLSPSAMAEAVPNLEIHTDAVKCSHAATISSFPEEHVFYLRSRGLSEASARTLLVESFLAEVHSNRKY